MSKTRTITIQEVKQALADPAFRRKLPDRLKEDVQKYEQNPECVCNVSIYRNILRYARKELAEYFPQSEIEDPDQLVAQLAQNHFSVINCHINDLEAKLKKLPSGRKQIQIARWQEQVTVIVNELDLIY